MKTIFEYTRSNILVIPQALFGMEDVTVLAQNGSACICLKHLERDLVDVEFYANTPCLIYIDDGYEVLTNSNNDVLELHSGSALFLPQGANLHSDYVKETGSLTAYLVFFDEQVVIDYLSKVRPAPQPCATVPSFFSLQDDTADFSQFFSTYNRKISDPNYLTTKLMELLHLIAWKGDSDAFQVLLRKQGIRSPKRNLKRLLEDHDVLRLSVSDLAKISCRSLSSFNRDFKAIYNMPPQTWLRDKRLAYAKVLLDDEGVTVTDAALAVGYENISNFIKAFKLKYGVTPKQLKLAK